nr:putative glycoside hydrolase [Microbulbifer salipaludis]
MICEVNVKKNFYACVASLCLAPLTAAVIANEDKPAQAESPRLVFAAGESRADWKLYVGNPDDWMKPVRGVSGQTRSPSNVHVEIAEDASGMQVVRASWNGGPAGQVLWHNRSAQDFSAIAAAGGALSLVVRVDEAPSEAVSLRMDCGYPCTGSFKFANVLSALPAGQWVRLGIPLSCFADAGTHLKRVDTPVLFFTTGTMQLSIADLRLEPQLPAESLVNCAS